MVGADVVLAGHAGIPFISQIKSPFAPLRTTPPLPGLSSVDTHWAALAGQRTSTTTWVNAGVIGVPANDGTPNGWYALVEPELGFLRISLRRLVYDHVTAAAAMRRSGHANGYARALITGIWPSHDILPERERALTGMKLRQKTIRIKQSGSKEQIPYYSQAIDCKHSQAGKGAKA